MEFKLIMENWRKFINELNRTDIIDKATADGGSASTPTPFIGHNYRTKHEIEDGTIQFRDITDNGLMTWTIVPFDNKRKIKYGHYELTVQPQNWDKIVTLPGVGTKEKTLALLKNQQGHTDQLKIFCTCPSFKYHYNDVANKLGVALYPPSQSPGMGITGRLANPGEMGITCKHSRRIIEVFPAYYTEVYRKIKELESRLPGGEEEPEEPV